MSDYEYGRRWSKKLPRRDIKTIVHSMHCASADDEVREEIRRRCVEGAIPEKLVPQCLDYAVRCHHAQRRIWLMFR